MSDVIKTIGSASGRDYSTWTAWIADLDASGVYNPGDSAIGKGYNDSTFEEIVDIEGDGETLGLQSVKITVASGQRHNGIADTGTRLLNPSNDNNAVLWMGYSAGGPYAIIEWIEIDGDNLTPDRDLFNSVLEFRPASGAIRNCIVHNGKNSLIASNVNPTLLPGHRYIFNNIVYDARKTGSSEQIEGIAGYVDAGNEIQVKNNTVYRILNYSSGNAYGIDNSSSTQAINNIVIEVSGSAIEKCFSRIGGISDYNISSDATAPGTNSFLNKTAQKQFISTIEGSENLKIRAYSDAVNAGSGLGATPEGVNFDILGRDRAVYSAFWDIGAHERNNPIVKKTVGSDPSRDYSTWTAWETDLDDETVYDEGSQAIGEGYNDSVFNEQLIMSEGGLTVGMNKITITVASGHRHNGTANTGVTLLNDGASDYPFDLVYQTGEGPLVIAEWLDINGNKDGNKKLLWATALHFTSGYFRNCIVHDASGQPGYGFTVLCAQSVSIPGNGFRYITNNIFYNLYNHATSTKKNVFGVQPIAQNKDNRIYNNTIYRIMNLGPSGTQNTYGIYNYGYALHQYKNNIVMGVYSANPPSGTSFFGTNEDYNLTDDSSAPGAHSIENKIPETQFISTLEGAENLHLKIESDAIGNAENLSNEIQGINIDIDGRDRFALGDVWDIGADERTAKPSMLWFILW